MKKLMILAAVTMAVSMLSASTVRWSASAVKTVSDSTVNAGNTYMALCFLSADSLQGTTISVTDAISKLNAGTLKSSDYAASAKLAGGMLTMSAGSAVDGGWGDGDSVTGFVIFVDNTDLTKVENYLVASASGQSEVSYTYGSSSENKVLAFGSQANNTKWTAVTSSVPEPTSGILLLLGMAGLALRRRRV